MKVVHINRGRIRKDQERNELADILQTKWDRLAKARVKKKYAALLKERRGE